MSTSPPATNIKEAVAVLRDLRERAICHPDLLNGWLVADTIDEVVVLLERRSES